VTRAVPVRLNPLERETVRSFRELVRVDSLPPQDAAVVLRGLERDYRLAGLKIDHVMILAVLYPGWDWGRVRVVVA